MIPNWKQEGYCEYVGYNNPNAMDSAKAFVIQRKNDNSIGTFYRKSYYAIVYLKDVEQMDIDHIVQSNLTLQQVLEKIEE